MEKKLNSEIVLPIHNTFLNAWAGYNFLTSIIQQKGKGYDWIINCLIQTEGEGSMIGGKESPNMCMGFIHGSYPSVPNSIYNYCPFITNYSYSKRLLQKQYDSFSNYLLTAIENGYYVWVHLDQMFTPFGKGKPGFAHPNYIYGFDKNKKEFFLADNFYQGKYGFAKVGFDEIDKSFELVDKTHNYHDFFDEIHLLKVIDSQFIFDINFLIIFLKDYLNSSGRYDITTRFITCFQSKSFYGMESYKHLQRYIEQLSSYTEYFVDVRSFCFLKDHKTLMKLRIEYLQEKNYIACSDEMKKAFEYIERQSQTVISLLTKYNLTKDPIIIAKVSKIIDDIKNKEQLELGKIVEELEKKFS